MICEKAHISDQPPSSIESKPKCRGLSGAALSRFFDTGYRTYVIRVQSVLDYILDQEAMLYSYYLSITSLGSAFGRTLP